MAELDTTTSVAPTPTRYQPNRDLSGDYTYPSPAAMPALGSYDLRTGPERTAAQLAADEARLADAEARLEQLEATVAELQAAVAHLTGIVHRYINRELCGDIGAEQ